MRVAIRVDDLRAPGCLAAVEPAVLLAPGITGLEIDLDGSALLVDFDERAIDEAQLRGRVRLALRRSPAGGGGQWGG